MNKSITPSMKLSALGSSISDKFAALRCLVDMVCEDSEHALYSPYTGEYLMESPDDESAFVDHFRYASPQEIVVGVCKFHYGLAG